MWGLGRYLIMGVDGGGHDNEVARHRRVCAGWLRCEVLGMRDQLSGMALRSVGLRSGSAWIEAVTRGGASVSSGSSGSRRQLG